jgi:hypothetical protein
MRGCTERRRREHRGAEGGGSGEGACPLPRKKFLIFNIKTVSFWRLLDVECFVSE